MQQEMTIVWPVLWVPHSVGEMGKANSGACLVNEEYPSLLCSLVVQKALA